MSSSSSMTRIDPAGWVGSLIIMDELPRLADERQAEGEGAAASRPRAARGEASTHALDEPAADRQPEPEAGTREQLAAAVPFAARDRALLEGQEDALDL